MLGVQVSLDAPMKYLYYFTYNSIKVTWFLNTMILPIALLSLLIEGLFYLVGVSSYEESFKGVDWTTVVLAILHWILSSYIILIVEEPKLEN